MIGFSLKEITLRRVAMELTCWAVKHMCKEEGFWSADKCHPCWLNRSFRTKIFSFLGFLALMATTHISGSPTTSKSGICLTPSSKSLEACKMEEVCNLVDCVILMRRPLDPKGPGKFSVILCCQGIRCSLMQFPLSWLKPILLSNKVLKSESVSYSSHVNDS